MPIIYIDAATMMLQLPLFITAATFFAAICRFSALLPFSRHHVTPLYADTLMYDYCCRLFY